LLFLSSVISASASASFCSVLLGSDTGCGTILGGDGTSLFQNCTRERVRTILWMYWTLKGTWFEAVHGLQFFHHVAELYTGGSAVFTYSQTNECQVIAKRALSHEKRLFCLVLFSFVWFYVYQASIMTGLPSSDGLGAGLLVR
jgi:hypothetical protein